MERKTAGVTGIPLEESDCTGCWKCGVTVGVDEFDAVEVMVGKELATSRLRHVPHSTTVSSSSGLRFLPHHNSTISNIYRSCKNSLTFGPCASVCLAVVGTVD